MMTDQKKKSNFIPECLSINLGYDCNLSCKYCFANDPGNLYTPTNKKEVAAYENAIRAGAGFVAEHCHADERKFFFGFQGDGEPLMHFDLLQVLYDICLDVCNRNNLPHFAFITSNGTMEDYKYQWIAHTFNRVCISMDGPPGIHNDNRPMQNGKPTHHRVKQTLDILRTKGCSPVCRTTVTAENVETLPETVDYLCHEMEFKDIQIEPVYRFNNSAQGTFPAELFVDNLLTSQTIANDYGSSIVYSGYRKNDPHGPYCNVLKKVLHISPKGNADVCTFGCGPGKFSTIGKYNPDSECMVIDNDRIKSIYEKLSVSPKDCGECPIIAHCVQGCPDICVLENNIKSDNDCHNNIKKTPRCRINRFLYQKGW